MARKIPQNIFWCDSIITEKHTYVTQVYTKSCEKLMLVLQLAELQLI